MRLVNRGFTATLLVLVLVAELALRLAATAPPPIVRIVYGTTLAMYMEIDRRLHEAAPYVRVLALGDSLAMTQFQPDVFARDQGWPVTDVFNAAYLGQSYRSSEMLLRDAGLDRAARLEQVLVFVNPRRLTTEGNADADVFRIAIPDSDSGTWRAAWRDRSVTPIFDRSRLYGLSRYLVSASWRQIGRPDSWDQVEYVGAQGGVAFDRQRPARDVPVFLYEKVDRLSQGYVSDLERLIEVCRERNVRVVLLPSVHHPSIQPFADAAAETRFNEQMKAVAGKTGATWIPLPAGGFVPPADRDFLDYGHLNRDGGVAFTHWLREWLVD